MKRKVWFAAIFVLLLLPGCSFAPQYLRPAAPVQAEWPVGEAYGEAVVDTPVFDVPTRTWQEHFSDGGLRAIIYLALHNNRDLRMSTLNVERARAVYGIQSAELIPSINVSGGYTRERISEDFSTTGHAVTTEQYSINLGITTWELDFFGRIRNLKDSALEEYVAMEQVQRAAQILLVSEVAIAWYALAADREILEYARLTLKAQEASYELVRKRYDNGVASELDLRRAQSQVETARRDEALYTQRLAQGENALTLLVGLSVSRVTLPSDLETVVPPRDLSQGLQSEVLLLRPDVLAAEHRLKASYANIGAARAAFFPRISLTTTIGTASSDLSALFNSGSDTWGFSPRLSVPVFDRRTRLAYKVTKVEREMALAEYEKAIQNAFREVADVLAARGTLDQRIDAQESLVEAAEETFRISEARYADGIDSYLSVLDAQRSLYVAKQGLIALRLEQVSNLVALYKTLGG